MLKNVLHLLKIKSNVILKRIFDNLQKNKFLEIIKYNKKIQNNLNLSIKEYKEYPEIEIEIIPILKKYDYFINLNNIEDKSFYHIYFNDSKKEIKRNHLNKTDKVNKIKVIIDHKVKTLNKLFYYCKSIESINFKRFYRANIIDMSYMFCGCTCLKKINFSNFNTNNVTDMSYMFFGCSLLKELNLSNFNTNKVKNMSYMFYECTSLKELNLSNFNTNKVINMSNMFFQCSSLKQLNLSNFKTYALKNISYMFCRCSSLTELNLSNFKNINSVDMNYMFFGCSDKLKKIIEFKI